jgi:hypothetical protein
MDQRREGDFGAGNFGSRSEMDRRKEEVLIGDFGAGDFFYLDFGVK